MYQHYARPGQDADGEEPGHAVAILSVQGSAPGVHIVDVNTDYQRLWGGSREEWLGAAPIIVQQEAANRQIFDQLHDALNPLLNDAESFFEGIGGLEVNRRHDGSRRYVEWRITAMGVRHNDTITLVLTQRNVTEQMEKEAQLERLATTDMLTGLVNRAQFDAVLKSEVNRQHRYARPLSLIMLDLDYFKQINDRHGHDVGDQVLVALADLLKCTLRKADCCARWGGEEFMLLAPETSLEQAVRLANKIRDAIKHTAFPIQGSVTASFGVVEVHSQDSVKSLMERVDNALYLAKEEGRDQVSTGGLLPSAKQA
ncbi:GGDEF domain-containing protein [Vreelandella titanicae]|uniref:GGDEF domain-containing protein n=1 Tax=Vreelandella titanicae TaxID=664683 RepID=UPI0008863322|nr:sensor domain-containing diguanylate cyclase [Halomonas titanicae]SDJ31142.1 diguanylate cyclase (GGDEF) domain-containing protein [Halomonas titanicae]|tara:strand:+ start:675 stop:1613 length:939 start_codon:yes stop_codon:yes gene_type:complete